MPSSDDLDATFSAAPGTLIAVPQLQDPNFVRSVVVMLVHNEEGALGFVINHETEHRCDELLAQMFELPWPADGIHLLDGGPVDPGGLWMLHDDEHVFEDSLVVTPYLVSSRSREALDALCNDTRAELRLRLGVGCAGWGPGQLEQELADGSWITGPVSPELVYDWPREEVWERALRELGIDPAMLVSGGGVQ